MTLADFAPWAAFALGWGYWHNAPKFTDKPHGRLAVTIVASAEVQIDLSITPRLVDVGAEC